MKKKSGGEFASCTKWNYVPDKINQVNKNYLKIFSSEGPKFYDKNISFIALSRSCGGEKAVIVIGSFEKCDHLIKSWKTATGLPHSDYQFSKISGVLFLFSVKTKELLFPITKFRVH